MHDFGHAVTAGFSATSLDETPSKYEPKQVLGFLQDPLYRVVNEIRGLTGALSIIAFIIHKLIELPAVAVTVVETWQTFLTPIFSALFGWVFALLGFTLNETIANYLGVGLIFAVPYIWLGLRQLISVLAPGSATRVLSVSRAGSMLLAGMSSLILSVVTIALWPFSFLWAYYYAQTESNKDRAKDYEGKVPPSPRLSSGGWKLMRLFFNPLLWTAYLLIAAYGIQFLIGLTT